MAISLFSIIFRASAGALDYTEEAAAQILSPSVHPKPALDRVRGTGQLRRKSVRECISACEL